MTKRRLLYNLLVDANADRQHTLPSILLRVTGRHRQERSELLQHDRARRRGARRLDYRHQGVRREVTGPSRRWRRRTNHQQLRLVHRKQAHGRPDAHTGHNGGRAERANGDGEHATVFFPTADEQVSPRLYRNTNYAPGGYAILERKHWDGVGCLEVYQELPRRAGEAAAGIDGLCAAARTMRARDIVLVGLRGGDQALAADALDHCPRSIRRRQSCPRSIRRRQPRRLLALLARVRRKLADAAPTAHMTALALHGTTYVASVVIDISHR